MLERALPCINQVTQLFKNPLIPATVDAAWVDELPAIAGLKQAPMLVIARPFSVDSKEETTLLNMLKACGFAEGEATVVQVNEGDVLPWSRVRNAAQPAYMLLMGVPPAHLGISALLSANAATEFGGIIIIWTSTLQHLAATEAARKALWVDVLQPLFKRT